MDKGFWGTTAFILFVVVGIFISLSALLLYMDDQEAERTVACRAFGPGWEYQDNSRYTPDCVNDKGEGKWLK